MYSMKQYYELYTLENSLQRVEKLLRTIAEDEDKPGVYETTKRRYKRIQSSLQTCLNYVEEIQLHYDIQTEHPDRVFEPDYTTQSSRSAVSNELEDRLKRIESRVFTSEDDEYYPEIDLTQVDDDSCEDFDGDNEEIYDATVSYFDRILHKVSSIDIEDLSNSIDLEGYGLINTVDYTHPLTCARLIYKWFHSRFVVCKDDTTFDCHRYKTTIPKVIRGIILGYAHWAKENKAKSFEKEVTNWCNNLVKTNSSKWGCPQLFTYYYKLPYHKSFSLEAAGIYETLIRLGYECLCEDFILNSDEFSDKGIPYVSFELPPDLIITPQLIDSSEDKPLLMNISSSGYKSIMETCPIFNKHQEVSYEENHYISQTDVEQSEYSDVTKADHTPELDEAYKEYRLSYFGIAKIIEIDEEDYQQWFSEQGQYLSNKNPDDDE